MLRASRKACAYTARTLHVSSPGGAVKNACVHLLEMSQLRAACCASLALTDAISRLLTLISARGRAPRRVPQSVRRRAVPRAEALQPQLLSELVAEEPRLPPAQAGVSVRQSPDVGYGEFCGAQDGVHVRLLHHLLRQLSTARLGEQLPASRTTRRLRFLPTDHVSLITILSSNRKKPSLSNYLKSVKLIEITQRTAHE